jgi:hypothetical protein
MKRIFVLQMLLLILPLTFHAQEQYVNDKWMKKQSDNIFYNPFSIQVDPMERLLLINFEKDPDSIYIGFEPQVFDDSINGTGHLIIGWRTDGKVDVYHQPTLQPDPGKFNIAGGGLNELIETPLEGGYFEVREEGVLAEYTFRDMYQREIFLSIKESNKRKRKPFGLLAPMGQAATHPEALPLVYLHDFYFVRRKKTEVTISIDGRLHKPDKMPMPMDGTGMYFIRYSPEPLIVTINPSQNGPLYPVTIDTSSGMVSDGSQHLSLINEALVKLVNDSGVYPVSMEFNPGFPNLLKINSGEKITGKFTIMAHPSTGELSGSYQVEKNDQHKVTIKLTPDGGWKPKPTKFSLWFLYTVAKVFKKWPTTYEWNATLALENPEAANMESNWKRK